jgi:hypothetical protein
MGDDEQVQTAVGGLGDIVNDAVNQTMAEDPSLAAEVQGYSDAQQGIPQSPSSVDPDYQPEYQNGWEEGWADKEAEVMAQGYTGPTIEPMTAEEYEKAKEDAKIREEQVRWATGQDSEDPHGHEEPFSTEPPEPSGPTPTLVE